MANYFCLIPPYDKKLFIEPPSVVLECPICFNILKDPVQCHQGHSCCKACLLIHLQRSELCPTCKCTLTEDTLVLNRVACSLLDDLEVVCFSVLGYDKGLIFGGNNEESTCKWTGSLKELYGHFESCEFALVKCPLEGCEHGVIRKNMERHLKEECGFRRVRCDACSTDIAVNTKDSHSLVCPGRLVLCPNNCIMGHYKALRFDGLEEHLEECGQQRVGCVYASIGCSVSLPRADMARHEKDPGAHMQHLFRALLRTDAKAGAYARLLGAVESPWVDSSHTFGIPTVELGEDFWSMDFQSAGYTFYFETYPCENDPGSLSVFLFVTDGPCFPVEVSFSVRCAVKPSTTGNGSSSSSSSSRRTTTLTNNRAARRCVFTKRSEERAWGWNKWNPISVLRQHASPEGLVVLTATVSINLKSPLHLDRAPAIVLPDPASLSFAASASAPPRVGMTMTAPPPLGTTTSSTGISTYNNIISPLASTTTATTAAITTSTFFSSATRMQPPPRIIIDEEGGADEEEERGGLR